MNSDNLTSLDAMPRSPAPARFRGSWKIWIGALFCTLTANILCLPLWTYYDVMGFIRTPFNREAHMEIMYTGTLIGSEPFAITSSESSLDTSTNFSYGKGAQFYRANMPIEGEWKSYSFTLRARKKGSIQISLKGPPESNDYGEKYSIFVDYRNLKINDKEIFSDRREVTHTECFAHQIPVNENDIIKISFDVRRHYFSTDDFHLLKTKNFWYVITMSILVFVVSYNLLYRAFLVSGKSKRVGDAVFLFIFFFLLAVPMSNISDAKKSVRELRTLKVRPKVSLILKENANFGRGYDDWFCDRLGGREWLIKLHDTMQGRTQRIVRGRRAWYVQDRGWLFNNLEWRLSSKDLNPAIKALVELRKFCEVNHIKLYVFVVPRKESVYQEHLYGYGIDSERSAAEKNFHVQMKHLAKKQHVPYIYPWTELRDACRQDYTFFKLSHHWTDWGTYIGYRVLMEEIRRDFPDMPVVSLRDYYRTQSELTRDNWCRDFHGGNLGRYFNFETDQRCPAATYNYYNHKNADKLVLNVGSFTKDFRYRGGAYKIMVIGTSQNENLMNFLPYSAAKTKYIRFNLGQLPGSEEGKIMKYYKKDILSYKPDVLILSLSATDGDLLNIQNIFKK